MIQVQPYGFLIGIGILVGAEAAERARLFLARRKKQYQQFSVWDGIWWVVLPALVGARAYHVIDYWEYYASAPAKIVATWEGGMGIWGGIIGGILGLGGYALTLNQRRQRRKISNAKFLISNFLPMADVAAVGLPLGQAIGRLGNFFNQELYGLPTRLPWGWYIKPENRLVGFESFEKFHPLFAYEAVWSLVIFIGLIGLIRLILRRSDLSSIKRKGPTLAQPGWLFFAYLGLYGLGRFFLEFLRINPWRWGMLTTAQWLGLIAIGAALFYSTRDLLCDKK